MVPLSAESRHESALAIAPPQDFGEAMMPYVRKMLELRTTEALAVLRQKFVALMNAAVRNPAYTRRIREATDQLKPEALMEVERSLERSYPSEMELNFPRAIKLLSDDFCLGLTYIRQKRGEPGVEEYLRALDIEKIVLVGKKLRMEQVEGREAEIEQRNVCNGQMSLADGFVSGKVAERENAPYRVRDIAHIEAWRKSVEGCDQYLDHADRTFGLTVATCNTMLANKQLVDYFELMFSGYLMTGGFAELAAFAATFCERNGAKPRNRILIPEKLLPAFQGLFLLEGSHWRIRPEEHAALRVCCEALFPNDPLALEMFERCMRLLALRVNVKEATAATDQPPESPVRILKLFPDASAQKQAAMTSVYSRQYSVSLETVERKDAKNSAQQQEKAFAYSALELMKEYCEGDIGWMPELAHQYPSGLEWHTVLLDSPEAAVHVINTLFDFDDIVCNGVAAELIGLLLSMDQETLNGKKPVDRIFVAEKDRVGESVQVQELQKWIKPENLHFAAQYLERLARPSLNREAPAISDVVPEMERNAELPLLQTKYWHPLYCNGARDMEQNIDLLKCTEREDLPRTINYLIDRGIIADEAQWTRLLWKLRDGATDDILLMHDILACGNPSRLSIAGLIFQYSEVEVGIMDCLATVDPERYGPESEHDCVDLPMDMFLHPDGQNAASLDAWRAGAIHRKSQYVFSPELRRTMGAAAAEYSLENASMVFSDVGIERELHSFFLADPGAFTTDDLRFLTALCAVEGHGLLAPVVKKMTRSPAKIQEQILTETLSASDAAEVACALLRELALAANDMRTVESLQLDSWAGKIPLDRKKYALIHRICSKSPEVRDALVAELKKRDPTTLLQHLSPHLRRGPSPEDEKKGKDRSLERQIKRRVKSNSTPPETP